MVFFTRSYQLQWNTEENSDSLGYNISLKPYRDNQNTKLKQYYLIISRSNPDSVFLKPTAFSSKFNPWIVPRSYLMLSWASI